MKTNKKKQAAKLVTATALGATVIACSTGCSGVGAMDMFSEADEGRFMMYATPEGMRAYNEGLVGIIADTKASPDKKSGYWQLGEERQKTRRYRLQLPFMKKQKEGGK